MFPQNNFFTIQRSCSWARMVRFISVTVTFSSLFIVSPFVTLRATPSQQQVSSGDAVVDESNAVSTSSRSPFEIQHLLSNVTDYFGIRYRFGGQTPAGFDCSGFVRYMFEKVYKIKLPHSSREMSLLGNRISKEELKPGDLVFFHSGKNRINHVGIYVGNDSFVHSSLSKGITEDKLEHQYYSKRYAGAIRLLPDVVLPPLSTPQEEKQQEVINPS